MIYYGDICYKSKATRPSYVVYITDYAHLLGLDNYYPPNGFPQLRPDTLKIRSAAQRDIMTIDAMAKDGRISVSDAVERILVIKRRPDVMLADAAWACKDPALLVVFHRPSHSNNVIDTASCCDAVYTIRRLRHYGTRNADGSYPVLGLSCGRAADKLGLHAGDRIGVEILRFAWEGWQDESRRLTSNYDGMPLWMWKSNASPDYFAGRTNSDGYPLPDGTIPEIYSRAFDSFRVRDSTKFYDPYCPDAPDTEDDH